MNISLKKVMNCNMLKYNTFGMNVTARCFMEYGSEAGLLKAIEQIKDESNVLHIGGGSNLLFKGDFDGVVLHSAIKGIKAEEENDDDVLVRVGSGEVWDDFVEYCVERGWGGVENLSLIPGEVGASAVQNIGAYGVEAKDVIALVEGIELKSGQKRVFGTLECDYSYRQSIFKNSLKGKYAITFVTYRLKKHPVLKTEYGNIKAVLGARENLTVRDVRQAIIDIRNAKLPDPKVLGNAGSFFMNPVVDKEKFFEIQKDYPSMPYYEVENGVKIPAGWMIEQCGWKGKSLGRAAVHDKQALVLVNLGGATSDEIVALSDAVCKSVADKFGVSIHPEVNFI
ncbi:MAG: UDP-N-acetylmuramate dehydrogenase [Prevotellaceae bacterium]|nr:UDP-N-acetylmuramate dehydrogenase [Candidatus Minthosoma caballi]